MIKEYKKKMLAFLKDCLEKDLNPTQDRYNSFIKNRNLHGDSQILIKIGTTFNELKNIVIEECNLNIHKKPSPNSWDTKELIEKVEWAIAKMKKDPSISGEPSITDYEELREEVGDLPSYSVILNRLGGWGKALSGNYGVRERKKTFCRDCLKENCHTKIENCKYWIEGGEEWLKNL